MRKWLREMRCYIDPTSLRKWDVPKYRLVKITPPGERPFYDIQKKEGPYHDWLGVNFTGGLEEGIYCYGNMLANMHLLAEWDRKRFERIEAERKLTKATEWKYEVVDKT